MDVLQRLQPLDVLFAILWACIIGWGLHSGTVRQLAMLLAVYAAAILAGSLYRQVGAVATYAVGTEARALLELVAYVVLFFLTFGLVSVIIWRAYPLSRLGSGFGLDNVAGAVVAGVWGLLLLIVLLTMLRYFALTPLKSTAAGQPPQPAQLDVQRQIQLSQVAPVLEVVSAPLWQALAPWFPSSVSPRI